MPTVGVSRLLPQQVDWDSVTAAALLGSAGVTVSRAAGDTGGTLLTVRGGHEPTASDQLSGAPTVLMSQLAVRVPDQRRDLRGAVHRLVEVRMDPSDVPAQAEYFRSRVVPENLLVADGFCGVRFLVDRHTGAGLVSTLWRDAAATAAVDALAPGRRGRGLTRGITIGTPSYEQVLEHRWGLLDDDDDDDDDAEPAGPG